MFSGLAFDEIKRLAKLAKGSSGDAVIYIVRVTSWSGN